MLSHSTHHHHSRRRLQLRGAFASPDSKRSFNRELFRTIAPRYAMITRILSFGRDRVWKERLVRALPDRKEPHCVDLACGNGDITRLLLSRYRRGSVTGIDLSRDMLNQAYASCRNSRVNLLEADLCDTGLCDASADVVTAGYALRNAPDLDVALDEIVRILKPGGAFGILDFSRSASPFWWRIQWMLLWFWGGLWGLLLHGNPAVYGYIAASLARFPHRTDLKRRLHTRGLHVVSHRFGFLGMAESMVAIKGDPS